MEQYLQAPLSIAELAELAGLSQRSILRRFRDTMSMSPYRYYRSLRVDLGRRLIDNSNLNVTEFALACGIDTRGSFSRAFKDIFGTSTSEHRVASKIARLT